MRKIAVVCTHEIITNNVAFTSSYPHSFRAICSIDLTISSARPRRRNLRDTARLDITGAVIDPSYPSIFLILSTVVHRCDGGIIRWYKRMVR